MKASTIHRLKYHHPRLLPYNPLPNIWEKLTGQTIENMKPRCTFAQLGSDCPILAPTQKGKL